MKGKKPSCVALSTQISKCSMKVFRKDEYESEEENMNIGKTQEKLLKTVSVVKN